MMTIRYTFMDSPIGHILLAGAGDQISYVGFPSGKGAIIPRANWQADDGAFCDARDQLQAYFAGKRKEFDLPLNPRGTAFQRKVWQALSQIPFGVTISYGDLARRIGRPTASRAVGAANGVNPIPIIIPCHRVVGSNGTLTGFGGGLEAKRWLLELERSSAIPNQPRFF